MTESTKLTEESPQASRVILTDDQAGQRLDKLLADLFPQYSRNRLQEWIKQGAITVNDTVVPPKYKVQGDEVLSVTFPAEPLEEGVKPENIPIDIVYQDKQLIVINKSADMVVHPAAGNHQGTLQNALLYHFPELVQVPRAGIVHRLDKETSGLLVVARTLESHKVLVDALQRRDVTREYYAIAQGLLISGGSIEAPVGRHPVDRKRMAVKQGGRDATTHYRIAQRYRSHTALHVFLETGRTHQIRVHMTHIKKPLLGDPVYGGRLRIPKNSSDAFTQALHDFKRQALHAARLSLAHPETGETMEWKAELPDDLQRLIRALQEDAQLHAD